MNKNYTKVKYPFHIEVDFTLKTVLPCPWKGNTQRKVMKKYVCKSEDLSFVQILLLESERKIEQNLLHTLHFLFS